MALAPTDLLELLQPDGMSDRERRDLFSELSEEEVRRQLTLVQLILAVAPRSPFHLRYERVTLDALKTIQRRRKAARP